MLIGVFTLLKFHPQEILNSSRFNKAMKKLATVILIVSMGVAPVFVFYPKTVEARASHHSLPSAKSAIVIDQKTGKTLFSRSSQTKRAPASTVKLLTALVVLDALQLDSVVRIPSGVVGVQPSRINLRTGEQFYVRDLLKAVLIGSANDAARALAIVTAGSEYQFAQRMNQKASALGALRSNFVTSNGLPAKNQYSTVYD
ncbi:MAG: D-alanyl-D-alanine carboxypeptidase, partial [Candidatus Omnitrophica bacterium]|nr:D-alanyl-D-alanine carboxypeptidase [Candidatus Omnitrophota bacterium]